MISGSATHGGLAGIDQESPSSDTETALIVLEFAVRTLPIQPFKSLLLWIHGFKRNSGGPRHRRFSWPGFCDCTNTHESRLPGDDHWQGR